MNTMWVALLRGADANNVAMPELEEALGQSGLREVHSVLDNGNLAFSSELARGELEEHILGILKSSFGVRKRPVILQAEQFREVVRENPFGDDSEGNIFVLFLRKPSLRPDFQQMERFKGPKERWCLFDDALYLRTPGEFRRSKLGVRLERLLGVCTAPRSWCEVTEISKLLV